MVKKYIQSLILLIIILIGCFAIIRYAIYEVDVDVNQNSSILNESDVKNSLVNYTKAI